MQFAVEKQFIICIIAIATAIIVISIHDVFVIKIQDQRFIQIKPGLYSTISVVGVGGVGYSCSIYSIQDWIQKCFGKTVSPS